MKPVTYEEYQRQAGKTVVIAGKSFKLEKPEVRSLSPESFDLEDTTVYSFPKRGDWATHHLNAGYRGNFASQIARNMILRYSSIGDTVLDPFCGSGTTLIEAKLLERKAVGVDINKDAVLLSWNRLDFGSDDFSKLFVGDAAKLDSLAAGSVDFVIAHPPYSSIIKYSDESGDLSNLPEKEFFSKMALVAKEFYRVLKPGRYCALLIGDGRKNGLYRPFAFQAMQAFLDAGFVLKEDIIKAQHNCSATGFWRTQARKFNFHLIMHEHLFVFRKK